MLAELRFRWRLRIADWIFQGKPPETPPVTLVQRRIYIVPSRTGYFFAGILILLLIASINYALSLGFLLTFLLAGMGGTAMLHTFRNLAQLKISPGKVEPVFAGETAQFGLVIHNPALPRYAVGVKRATQFDAPVEFGDVAAGTGTTFHVPVPAERRGRLQCGRVEIFTEYPVGLFHSWSYVNFGANCLVYPKPDPGDGALPLDARAKGEGNVPVPGDEEFQSLRAYRPGDTPRQIAWKALAREQGLLVKEFGSTASAELWLDYAHLEGMGTEQRLSRMTWWVMEAERTQLPYGLRLPGRSLRPSLGALHRDQCLEALALFGAGAETGV